MIKTVATSNQMGNIDTLEFEEAPAWYLEYQRVAALNRARDPFDTAGWVLLVQQSDLHPADKATALDIAADSNHQGISYASRHQLAMQACVTRVATITARLQRLRNAGFLDSSQRFNKSSQHRLTMAAA